MDISTKSGAIAALSAYGIKNVMLVINGPAYEIPNWVIGWLTVLCLVLGSAAAFISLYEWIRAIGKDKKWEQREDEEYKAKRR